MSAWGISIYSYLGLCRTPTALLKLVVEFVVIPGKLGLYSNDALEVYEAVNITHVSVEQ